MDISPRDWLGREIVDLSAFNPAMPITDEDRYAAQVYALIDSSDPANCQVRLETGQHTDSMTATKALDLLESVPFASLEIWNGRAWETVWNGAVEFEGITP